MGACDTWNVEINILVYENEMFSLPAEFHFNNYIIVCQSSFLNRQNPPFKNEDTERYVNELFQTF